jgi:outer membrane protein assembly factor BamB
LRISAFLAVGGLPGKPSPDILNRTAPTRPGGNPVKSPFPSALFIRFALVIMWCFTCGPWVWSADWPQWLGPLRDGVWRETGILTTFPPEGPPVRWRTPVGSGYAGPAVASGRVYVADRTLGSGESNPANPFERATTQGTERIHCLDQSTGEILWTHEYECPYTVSYPAGPRATPLVAEGKVYTLGAEGHLKCLHADSGEVLWSRALKDDYELQAPVWGFSASPLLDGDRLICLVGGKGSVVVAFHKDSGEEIWRALSAAEPGYCPPVIYEAGGKRQLIIWHPQAINSLDPVTGNVYWSVPFDVKAGLTISMPRQLDDLLFVTSFYNGPVMLQLDRSQPAATLLWKGKSNSERNTDKLNSIMSTPFLEAGHIYGVCSYGQLRCLTADTGERLWEDLKATGSTGDTRQQTNRWANAFLIKHEDRFFLANERGDLIVARLTPQGYQEISRAHLLEPTNPMAGRDVVWSHPAFANQCVYLRNDQEIICVDLREDTQESHEE